MDGRRDFNRPNYSRGFATLVGIFESTKLSLSFWKRRGMLIAGELGRLDHVSQGSDNPVRIQDPVPF